MKSRREKQEMRRTSPADPSSELQEFQKRNKKENGIEEITSGMIQDYFP